jgi:hypothetical protein
MFYVLMSRDPRDLVTSIHHAVPSQYFQGADYQMLIGPKGMKSFSTPGVIPCLRKIQEIVKDRSLNSVHIGYEEFLENPFDIGNRIRAALALQPDPMFAKSVPGNVSSQFDKVMNGARLVRPQHQPAWVRPYRLYRATAQVDLFPELETLAIEFGYPPFEEILERAAVVRPDLYRPTGTICAFYTDDEIYRNEARRLAASINKLDLPLAIKSIQSNGSWIRTCAFKPQFILDQRRSIRGPLLYVDVDAVIHADPWPYLHLFDGDLAVCVKAKGTLASGTVLINDTPGALKILSRWVELQLDLVDVMDQEVLHRVVLEIESDPDCPLRIQRLPDNLCYIFDRTIPYYFGITYIEHLQASRENFREGSGRHSEALSRRKKRIQELEAAGTRGGVG